VSRRAGSTGRSDGHRRHRSVRTPGPMALIWITATRGVMAIVLGLALALNGDRAPAALVNFMGVYWILNGIVSLQWGLAAEGSRRRLPLAAGAIGTVTGAVVLVADVGTTFLVAILGVVIALTGSRMCSAASSSPTGRVGAGAPECHWGFSRSVSGRHSS
jgi:uncharacterized membrane protein HdeD (DUF308 family)